jgi:hypothetical protein
VIRHINSFSPKNLGNVKDIPSSSSISSNLYQHQFSLSKWQVGNITNLKESTSHQLAIGPQEIMPWEL